MRDFHNRFVSTEHLAFHTPATTIEIDPGTIFRAFSERRIHGAALQHIAGIAILADIRTD
jgi:hypothetical protein